MLKSTLSVVIAIPLAVSFCLPPADPLEAYFEDIESITQEFVQSRDAYNTVAMRASIDKTSSAYQAQLDSASSRRRVLIRNLGLLENMVPDDDVARYHDLQIDVHKLSIEWLDEILIAYSENYSRRATDEAYDKAQRILGSIDFVKSEMQRWLLAR
ncbi:MAG: hypothetical protein IH867_01870 [Chloroflexi bacterium]|nr:hypothetical protein [Chloroflexota bacterium]